MTMFWKREKLIKTLHLHILHNCTDVFLKRQISIITACFLICICCGCCTTFFMDSLQSFYILIGCFCSLHKYLLNIYTLALHIEKQFPILCIWLWILTISWKVCSVQLMEVTPDFIQSFVSSIHWIINSGIRF